MRETLVLLLNQAPHFHCLAGYANAESALKGIPLEQPDVLLMDLHLPKISGVECVRQLRPRLPELKIIMLTKFEDANSIVEALKAGANGYVLKKHSPAELVQAVKAVCQGHAPMSSEVAARMVQFFHDQGKRAGDLTILTPRERQILELLSKGHLYKEISETLGITYPTVNSHVKSIYDKLQVHSRTEAVAKYLGR